MLEQSHISMFRCADTVTASPAIPVTVTKKRAGTVTSDSETERGVTVLTRFMTVAASLLRHCSSV